MDRAWQRRLAAAVVAVCLTYLVASLLFDKRQGEGPVILVLTATHGVHSGDVPVVLAWLVGVAGCAWIAWRA
ncbi:hypothetical protein [Nocardioides sp.]|uniref:hypothetical protein n=1 Tax=Nocardioides sp. TaxID=35761 RepID=UPI000C8AA2AC|nr:hypothetical protein [Pimelobacter sp.]